MEAEGLDVSLHGGSAYPHDKTGGAGKLDPLAVGSGVSADMVDRKIAEVRFVCCAVLGWARCTVALLALLPAPTPSPPCSGAALVYSRSLTLHPSPTFLLAAGDGEDEAGDEQGAPRLKRRRSPCTRDASAVLYMRLNPADRACGQLCPHACCACMGGLNATLVWCSLFTA